MIDKYCNTKEGRLYAFFIDFLKDFDSVVHNVLKLKLLRYKMGTKFYRIINNMKMKSEACIEYGNFFTVLFPVKSGVCQGDNLSLTYLKELAQTKLDFKQDRRKY